MSQIIKLRGLLRELLPSAADIEISEETNLRTDLGLDSLRLVDVMVNIEERYNIIFDESSLDPSSLTKVGDLINIIEKTIRKENI